MRPTRFEKPCEAIRDRWPEIETFHMHLHNSRGATIASYYEALRDRRATEFDTSLGGMGGCPYCGNGRSAGHVPTEDFVDSVPRDGYRNRLRPRQADRGSRGSPKKWLATRCGAMCRRPDRGPRATRSTRSTCRSLNRCTKLHTSCNGPSVYEGQLSPWGERSALNS